MCRRLCRGGSSINEPLKDVEAFRAEVLQRLGGTFESMVEDLFSDIGGRVPACQQPRAPGALVDVRSALRRAGRFFVHSLAENRTLQPEEIVALQAIGAQRARQGLPRDGLAAAIQAAMRTGYRSLVASALEVDAPADVAVRGMATLSLRLFEFVQDATSALLSGYVDEEALRLTSRVREQAALVDRLLEASWVDDEEILGHAKELGLDVSPPAALLLVTNGAGREPTTLAATATRLADGVPGSVEGPTRSVPVPHAVVLVPDVSEGRWAELLAAADEVASERAVYIACVEPVEHLRSVAAVYRRVQRDLVYVPAARSGPGAVGMKEVKAYRILACAPLEDRLDFFRQTFDAVFELSEQKTVELLDTLESLYDHRGQTAEVAAELGIHEKTVRCRLRRIEALTGLSVDVPGDRLQLDIAVRLRRLAMAEVAPFEEPVWGPRSRRR
ncbi:MAG TPA: helix-turn-helix domain-containing protein [Acidimicrobiales bacterium]